MILGSRLRIIRTWYRRAPNVFRAMALLLVLGVLLGFYELRSMELIRAELSEGPSKPRAATRLLLASDECRRTEQRLLTCAGDEAVQGQMMDNWSRNWDEVISASQALAACLGSDDPRVLLLSVNRLDDARQTSMRRMATEPHGPEELSKAADQGDPPTCEELESLSSLANQIVVESDREFFEARKELVNAITGNFALAILLTIVPGALIVAGGFQLVRDCRDSEARLKAAFSFSLHPMIVTDPQGKIESASQSVKAVFGWEPIEIVGQNVNILMPVPFRSAHEQKVAAHLATGRETLIGKPRELMAMRRDGTPFPCIVTLWKAPLPRKKNDYLLMAIISDITQQKANEAKIAELNQQVIVAARQAGKAEIATNILHNVGNVLNSVNVASSLIRESLQSTSYHDVQRVSALIETPFEHLAEFIAQDPRGCHLPRFVLELFGQLQQQRESMDSELLALEKSIDHIKAIVESQQQYAKGISRVIEPIDVSQVVADAVRISEASLSSEGIAVEVYSQPMPMVLLDEQKFLHVLVNLIGNARHACMESGAAVKQVKIWVQHADEHVCVKIEDNGVGIDPTVITRIFNHGFTTRKGGHGFGLHSVALAIEESCGSIEVQSAGIGHGATFSIRIPVLTSTSAGGQSSTGPDLAMQLGPALL